ncbi:MAG: thermonuclease family protein [Cyanobacteria bacterium REEB67]|nr:thermonuclease family protein [Cyanobacteria bacterium REEB67]
MSEKILRACLATALSVALAQAAQADSFKARVVSVVDGDTINVVGLGGGPGAPREKVILYGIDCPEPTQDFGAQAKQFTDQACFRKEVTVDVKSKDSHGRLVATIVLADGSNLNEALLANGLAWWSDKFAPNEFLLKQMHESARTAHKGLWSAPNPVPPWVFRNGDKNVQAEIKTK